MLVIGAMTPLKFIRTRIFKMTQTAFSEATGIHQTDISDLENERRNRSLTSKQIQRIMNAAIDRGLPLSYEQFFTLPADGAE